MATQLFILFIVLCGGIAGAVFSRKPFEECLPLHMMGLVVVLYVFGLAGHLKAGVYAVVFFALAIYIACVCNILRKKNYKEVAGRLLTPAFFLFILLFCLIGYLDKGMVAWDWDEFSHWMDSVKTMTYLDDFMTNPASNGLYRSYPPGMSLMQYLFQKIHLMVKPDAPFSEWRGYFAYKVYILSLLLPFMNGARFREPVKLLCHAAVVLLVPLALCEVILISTLIDSFVGTLAGCAFAMLLTRKTNTLFYAVYLSAYTFTLVLSKDVGLFFAAFVSVAYVASFLLQSGIPTLRGDDKVKPLFGRKMLPSVMPLIATFVARGSWRHLLQVTDTPVSFGGRIDLLSYTSMFFLHNGTTWHQEVVDRFQHTFFERRLDWLLFDTEVSHAAIFVLIAAGLLLLAIRARQDNRGERYAYRLTTGLVVLCLVLYIYSLGATYVSNFSEGEALGLAAYERYMSIAYQMAVIVLFAGIVSGSSLLQKHIALQVIFCALIVVVSPLGLIGEYLRKEPVEYTNNARAWYVPVTDLIHAQCGTDDRVWLIAQGGTGKDYMHLKYLARPVPADGRYSLGEPQYEGDTWSYADCTGAEDWMTLLDEGDYNYIALYRVNDYFREHFSGVFSDPSAIADNTLFRRNETTGLFDVCGEK